jgi:DisA bacterial checkpoint controller nucleotide-binding
MHVIKHFMWGYQRYFRVIQEGAAKGLFQKIDQRLKPELFIVGILSDGAVERFNACVEPEDEYWIKSEDFDGAFGIAERLRGLYPEAGMFQSHPLAQQSQDEDLFKRSIRDAVRQIVESHSSRPSGMTFRVSHPAKVGCYWVCVVLGLQDVVLASYPTLRTSYVKMHEHRHIPVPASLIEAAADAFLEATAEGLLRPNPGLGLTRKDPDELLRSAGDGFINGVVWRVDQNCIEGMHDLFRSLTTISSLRYEKAAGHGRILVARKGHPSVAEKVSFAAPVKLTSYRSVRKVLELASDELPLHCDPDRIYGLAQQLDYDPETEDMFEVQILGHHHWEIKHAHQVLMRVQYGLPSLPRLPFDEEKFRTDLPRIFRHIAPIDMELLVDLVKVAEQESHGTMLVITEAAEAEAVRLKQQATPVKPFLVDTKTLQNLTPIDGAIILDPQGHCHAIGAILDGKATDSGDPSRGARYNSALRYYEAAEAPCMVVVVSSDGGIDFVPNPMPAIRRSLVDSALQTIIGFESAGKIGRNFYRQTLDWLDAHRFYLTEEDCKSINPVVQRLEERIRGEDEAAIWIVRTPFTPNSAMIPALYYMSE